MTLKIKDSQTIWEDVEFHNEHNLYRRWVSVESLKDAMIDLGCGSGCKAIRGILEELKR